jgi:uncharacterized protein involved in tolerance to divalent cations
MKTWGHNSKANPQSPNEIYSTTPVEYFIGKMAVSQQQEPACLLLSAQKVGCPYSTTLNRVYEHHPYELPESEREPEDNIFDD